MKLALECRADMLEMVQPFGDFDWILAHKVLGDEKYADWYKESGNIKFIDNSVNELGEPLPIDKLKEAFEKVGGTYIVAPDYLGEADKTIAAYEECIKAFPKEKVIGVIQGPTFTDAFECLNTYGKGVVAIPYDLCSKKTDPPWLMGLRRCLFVTNIPKDQGIFVHLLGFNSLDEFFWYQTNPIIMSIDTGVPILLGLEGLDILDPLESKEEPTLNRMEKIELTQQGWTGIIRNIALLRKSMP
jgi:hypothetical protein